MMDFSIETIIIKTMYENTRNIQYVDVDIQNYKIFGAQQSTIFVGYLGTCNIIINRNLRVGDRILKLDGFDINRMPYELFVQRIQNSMEYTIMVRHDPPITDKRVKLV